MRVPTLIANSLPLIPMAITHTDCLFTYRSWNLLFPAVLSYPGRCLATCTAQSFSTFQGPTGHPAVYTQGLWACSTYVPPVLSLLWPVPMDLETLLYFDTFLADAKGLQHGTIIEYLYGVYALHINMGLPDPLKGVLRLHKCLRAIHIQSNLESQNAGFHL